MPHHGWKDAVAPLLLLAMLCSVCATSPWYRYVHQEYQEVPTGEYDHHDEHHRECDHQHHGGRNPHHHQGGGLGYEQNGCACLLFAESRLVYTTEDASSWRSCDERGLRGCGQHCERLFQDENARFRGLQNACDTLGREVITPLYRRHQVCGQYGPYEDVLLNEDLCCRRGRPSEDC